MTDADHVKAFRLFDQSKARASGEDFELKDWEKEHLHGCEECRAVLDIFARLFNERPPLYSNGETNHRSAWYRSLCCGIETFIPEGKNFPDCQRHKNLPTRWKHITDEPIPHVRDLKEKKRGGSAA